eukprot:353033-Chlamydomonas_euryale.AAC.13
MPPRSVVTSASQSVAELAAQAVPHPRSLPPGEPGHCQRPSAYYLKGPHAVGPTVAPLIHIQTPDRRAPAHHKADAAAACSLALSPDADGAPVLLRRPILPRSAMQQQLLRQLPARRAAPAASSVPRGAACCCCCGGGRPVIEAAAARPTAACVSAAPTSRLGGSRTQPTHSGEAAPLPRLRRRLPPRHRVAGVARSASSSGSDADGVPRGYGGRGGDWGGQSGKLPEVSPSFVIPPPHSGSQYDPNTGFDSGDGGWGGRGA